jgi:6-phosphogluconolactonase (cycloisomerase 2 family)
MQKDGRIFAYIGRWDMYGSQTGNGFGICRYDAETGRFEAVKSAFPQVTVGAACLEPTRTVLYCTNETATYPGNFRGGGGEVYALAVDSHTGDLREINRRPSYGSQPAYVAVDGTGRYLIVVHHTGREAVTKVRRPPNGKYRIDLEYDDATTVLFPLSSDGSIGDPIDIYTHSGAGGPLAKQTHPQLHSVTASPSGALFAVCDKGNDEIVMFKIDESAGKLIVCGGPVKTVPGSQPRYGAFHPTLPHFFINHESKSLVSAFRYDDGGRLEAICSVNALPQGTVEDVNTKQSDLRIHPSGRFLYTLIRGINAATVFAVSEDGSIERLQTVMLGGAEPRGCAISPDERFLHIAMFKSHEIRTWAITPDGTLRTTDVTLHQPNAGTITFHAISA